MSNRYVTEAEKEGAKRRQAEYRARVKKSGRLDRRFNLNDREYLVIKEIIEVWRDEYLGNRDERFEMMSALKPI
jgi:hypothetical protein